MRSYRGRELAQSADRAESAESAILGAQQLAWLKSRLAASTATWKVIASDMPLGLIITDRPAPKPSPTAMPARRWAASWKSPTCSSSSRDKAIKNVVFITADVHYAAAHYYDPAAAKFSEFNPFWEFIAGPAHAGTFGPGQLDATFGPQLKFLGIPRRHEGEPPAERRPAVLRHARNRRRQQAC